MEKQKIYSKIIVLLLFCLLPVNISAQYDYKNMRIGVEVNGQPFNGKVVLHDNDTCTFFLLDKEGNKVTYLSSKENYSFEWNIKFPKTGGGIWKKRLNVVNSDSILGIRISPDLFEEQFVKNVRSGMSGFCTYTDGEITCDLKSASWYVYTMPIELDVLPPVPTIDITEQYVYPDTVYMQGNDYIATFSITAEQFDMGTFYMYDPTLPPNSGIFNYFLCEIFEYPCEMPILLTLDYLLPEVGFWCEFHNDYGWIGSDLIYPDWSQANVSYVGDEAMTVSVRGGFCDVTCINPIGNIRIFDMNGRIVFSDKEKSEFHIPLNKGLYILDINDNKGKITRKKILMK